MYWLARRPAAGTVHQHFTEITTRLVGGESVSRRPRIREQEWESLGARSFRRAHGQTLGEYVRRLRIEDACRRLITTESAITEVALECGFSDHSHFARVFRRHMGVSPGRFREAHRR